jgi:ABC-type bacteriocin/lantibiotic exporter with double-glycine peptidase domain
MQKVARNLRWALAGRTAIVITHDPDVFETDLNLFFDEGGIADVGPHEDLLLRNAQYAELIRTTVTERRKQGGKPRPR